MSDEKKYESSVLTELAWRDRIEQVTHDELDEKLASGSLSLYCGFDPSASSLTAGNLVPLAGLAFFHRHGHRVIALGGGATGRIGDPSGKAEERKLRSVDEIEADAASQAKQMRTVLARSLEMHPETLGERAGAAGEPVFVNNADWMLPWNYIDFLREVGKHFRVNAMIAKESVKARLQNREQGISYTEFSYMLIQAYDFLHLFEAEDCVLQIGGSDQWGNITAGTDLIRRKHQKVAYGLTFPLLTTASGEKMGKTEKGALWLDAEQTSPYEWYQYWVNQADADVVNLLKTFTFLSREEVESVARSIEDGHNTGDAQRTLAWELTELIHGRTEAEKAVQASKVLFGGAIESLNDSDLLHIFKDVPSVTLSRDALAAGYDLLPFLVATGAVESKGAGKRLIQQGGGYINNLRVAADKRVTPDDLASESIIVIRTGKKKYRLVRFE